MSDSRDRERDGGCGVKGLKISFALGVSRLLRDLR